MLWIGRVGIKGGTRGREGVVWVKNEGGRGRGEQLRRRKRSEGTGTGTGLWDRERKRERRLNAAAIRKGTNGGKGDGRERKSDEN